MGEAFRVELLQGVRVFETGQRSPDGRSGGDERTATNSFWASSSVGVKPMASLSINAFALAAVASFSRLLRFSAWVGNRCGVPLEREAPRRRGSTVGVKRESSGSSGAPFTGAWCGLSLFQSVVIGESSASR